MCTCCPRARLNMKNLLFTCKTSIENKCSQGHALVYAEVNHAAGEGDAGECPGVCVCVRLSGRTATGRQHLSRRVKPHLPAEGRSRLSPPLPGQAEDVRLASILYRPPARPPASALPAPCTVTRSFTSRIFVNARAFECLGGWKVIFLIPDM